MLTRSALVLASPRSDITIVVDSGKVKETQFEAERGMQLLVEVLTRSVTDLMLNSLSPS